MSIRSDVDRTGFSHLGGGLAMSDEAPGGTGPSAGFTAIFAVVVLGLYVALLVTLVAMRHDRDWDHLVYVLGGFEAIVFAAVGWVFGTSVARGTVRDAKAAQADAKQQAAEAKQTASTERQVAERARADRDRAVTDAERGRSLAASVKAKRASVSGRLGARPEDSATSPEMAELADLAERLFPDQGSSS
jgi:hypothetical protein